MKWLALTILCLMSSSCTRGIIDAETAIVNSMDLASDYVNTPDPRRYYPWCGQELIIKWSLPRYCWSREDLYLSAVVRYYNLEEELLEIPINTPIGSYIYPHVNEHYDSLGPILAYKIELIGTEGILYEWKHVLWTELIQIHNAL